MKCGPSSLALTLIFIHFWPPPMLASPASLPATGRSDAAVNNADRPVRVLAEIAALDLKNQRVCLRSVDGLRRLAVDVSALAPQRYPVGAAFEFVGIVVASDAAEDASVVGTDDAPPPRDASCMALVAYWGQPAAIASADDYDELQAWQDCADVCRLVHLPIE